MRRHVTGLLSRTIRAPSRLPLVTPLPSFTPTSLLHTLKPHTPPIPVKSANYSRTELEHLLPNIPQQPALPKTPLPILSIGAGNIVQVAHYPSYKSAGFTVAGITDANPATAEATAKEFSIPKVYASVEEMVAAHKGEKVVYDIAVPAKAILSILRLLPRGAYALIQKPMGETIEEARAIRDLCREKQITGAVNFQLRTAAYSIALKELIRQGVIGEVTGIDFRINVRTPWEKWVFLEQAARMEVIYHSIHYIDFIRDLYGDPQYLHCLTYKHRDTPKLHSVRSNLLFLYSTDVQATIHTNHGHRWGHDHAESYLKVEGTQGAVKLQMGGNIAYPRSDLDYLKVVTDATKGEWLDIELEGSWFPDGPPPLTLRATAGHRRPHSTHYTIHSLTSLVSPACRSCPGDVLSGSLQGSNGQRDAVCGGRNRPSAYGGRGRLSHYGDL